jgi:hypothetical protein
MDQNAKLIGTGLAGAALSALCCLTPLLVVLLSAHRGGARVRSQCPSSPTQTPGRLRIAPAAATEVRKTWFWSRIVKKKLGVYCELAAHSRFCVDANAQARRALCGTPHHSCGCRARVLGRKPQLLNTFTLPPPLWFRSMRAVTGASMGCWYRR